jgi:hypothetical protein
MRHSELLGSAEFSFGVCRALRSGPPMATVTAPTAALLSEAKIPIPLAETRLGSGFQVLESGVWE